LHFIIANANYKCKQSGREETMKRVLSPWCKAVKKAMIDENMDVMDLASGVNFTREYTSSVINGRVISDTARRVISDFLNIPNDDSLV